MLGYNVTGGFSDTSFSDATVPCDGLFFINKELIILEKLNADKKENIDYFFKSQLGNYKS